MKLEFEPVGEVVERGEVSHVRIFEKYGKALENIEQFSHSVVLYWMHAVTPELRQAVKVQPPWPGMPNLGIFASRFPTRPNPIGLITVRLVSREDDSLFVRGLDADEGTPIIDIKPYNPFFDMPKGELVLPEWGGKYVKEHLRKIKSVSMEDAEKEYKAEPNKVHFDLELRSGKKFRVNVYFE